MLPLFVENVFKLDDSIVSLPSPKLYPLLSCDKITLYAFSVFMFDNCGSAIIVNRMLTHSL